MSMSLLRSTDTHPSTMEKERDGQALNSSIFRFHCCQNNGGYGPHLNKPTHNFPHSRYNTQCNATIEVENINLSDIVDPITVTAQIGHGRHFSNGCLFNKIQNPVSLKIFNIDEKKTKERCDDYVKDYKDTHKGKTVHIQTFSSQFIHFFLVIQIPFFPNKYFFFKSQRNQGQPMMK